MPIDKFKDWELGGGKASRIRKDRLQEENVQKEADRQMNNPFLKGMVSAKGDPSLAGKAIPKTPVESGKEPPKTEIRQSGTAGGKPQDTARSNAERAHQGVREKFEILHKTVFKTQTAARQEKNAPEKTPEKQGAENLRKEAAKPDGRTQASNVVTAETGAKTIERNVKPETAKKDEKGKTAERGERSDSSGGERAKVDNKGRTEGSKADANYHPSEGGNLPHVTHTASHGKGEAGGAKREVGGNEVGGKNKVGDKKGEGSTKGARGAGRAAYTGTSEARRTTAELGNLLAGGGSESPFDIAPQADDSPPVEYEPVRWNTGTINFTDATKSEEIRLAAMEHKQRTVKPLTEKVDYSNWDLSKQAIQKRFILETAEVLKLAQQIIHDARLPKDPRGLGTHC